MRVTLCTRELYNITYKKKQSSGIKSETTKYKYVLIYILFHMIIIIYA